MAKGHKADRETRWARVRRTTLANRRRAATVLATGLAVAMGLHVITGQNGLIAYEHKRAEAQDLNSQMQTLQRENDRLRGHVERLRNDPDAIEHQARQELHYTRPGEIIYTLAAEPAAAASKR